jgi:hypothetical protein
MSSSVETDGSGSCTQTQGIRTEAIDFLTKQQPLSDVFLTYNIPVEKKKNENHDLS